MPLSPMKIASFLWLAFIVYVVMAAMNVKRSEVKENRSSRWVYLALVLAGAFFIFTPYPRQGSLAIRFVPVSHATGLIGLLLIVLGLAFAAWARRCLGRNWSASVTLKKAHKLVKTGPYAYFRHPMYVGLGLALLGTAVVQGQWKALLGVLLCFGGLWKKSRTEDALLLRYFGARNPTLI